jgi:tetratricopeptide (TPR) repeat protein
MKRIIILFFTVILAFSAYSQTILQEGNRCFDKGDYVCAEEKYKEALEFTIDDDKPKVEIGLMRAQQCAKDIKIADQEFAEGNYDPAKEKYQKVLDSNPKDPKAKSRLEECNNFLATASIQEGNNYFEKGKYASAEVKYGEALNLASGENKLTADKGLEKAQLCAENIKAADLEFEEKNYRAAKENYQIVLNSNPQDAYAKSRLEKCSEFLNLVDLKVSKETLFFSPSGGNERINVEITNASSYSVVALPSWCTAVKDKDFFTITCSENSGSIKRADYFTVTAGDKKVRINVEQTGKTVNQAKTTTKKSIQGPIRPDKCFNCPKTHDTWGLTLGYAGYSGYSQETFADTYFDGIQFGLRVEPLFKYGFGLNTGLLLEMYSKNIEDNFDFNFELSILNIPLHLEYRLNFSKWFNMFFYGGLGFNAITNSSFEDYAIGVTSEYGGGFRISHVQLNIGYGLHLNDFNNMDYFGDLKTFPKVTFSISYMF